MSRQHSRYHDGTQWADCVVENVGDHEYTRDYHDGKEVSNTTPAPSGHYQNYEHSNTAKEKLSEGPNN